MIIGEEYGRKTQGESDDEGKRRWKGRENNRNFDVTEGKKEEENI